MIQQDAAHAGLGHVRVHGARASPSTSSARPSPRCRRSSPRSCRAGSAPPRPRTGGRAGSGEEVSPRGDARPSRRGCGGSAPPARQFARRRSTQPSPHPGLQPLGGDLEGLVVARRGRDLALGPAQQPAVGQQDRDADGDDVAAQGRVRASARSQAGAPLLRRRARARGPWCRRRGAAGGPRRGAWQLRGGPSISKATLRDAVLLLERASASRAPSGA